MTAHALLSASAAHRWLHCTAAPKFETEFPDRGSPDAEAGTLAHAIAELKLRKYAVEPMSQATYTRRLNKLKKVPYTVGEHEGELIYTAEMDGYTDDYLDHIKCLALAYAVKPYIMAEKCVDYSAYATGGFGTADCLIVRPDEIHVIDFKYGKGVPVEAEGNPQMRLYALGAIAAMPLYNIERVKMTIFQPRIGNISTAEMSAQELKAWAEEEVKPKAQEAYSGKGKFAAGEWCRFCRAKQECKARAEHYLALHSVSVEKADVRRMTHEELGRYLTIAGELNTWAQDMQDYALSVCLAGGEVPGWKAVEGRGSRVWRDQDKAFSTLIAGGIDEAILYERVPLSLAQTEKAVGKKEFQTLVGELVVKNPGKPTLAPESDKRPAVTNQTKAADVFKAEAEAEEGE